VRGCVKRVASIGKEEQNLYWLVGWSERQALTNGEVTELGMCGSSIAKQVIQGGEIRRQSVSTRGCYIGRELHRQLAPHINRERNDKATQAGTGGISTTSQTPPTHQTLQQRELPQDDQHSALVQTQAQPASRQPQSTRTPSQIKPTKPSASIRTTTR